MKNTPENTGRKIIFKNILISLAVLFLLPLLMVFIMNVGRGSNLDYFTFYKNVFKSVSTSPVSIVGQAGVLCVFIYFISGITGRKIVNEKTNPFKTTFISLNLIWLCFFVIAMLNETIISALNFGLSSDVPIAWLVYGLVPFSIASLIYSILLSILISREFKKVMNKK